MAEQEKQKETTREDPRYSPEELIEESRSLLGCARHIAVGAFHGEERKTLTTAQGKARVKSFMDGKADHS